jgi:hypothetical protein
VIGSGCATPLGGSGSTVAFPPAVSVVTLLAGVAWHRWSAGGTTLSVFVHTDEPLMQVPNDIDRHERPTRHRRLPRQAGKEIYGRVLQEGLVKAG